MSHRISRRNLLGTAVSLGAACLVPRRAAAQAKTLVAATFPGTWNEAHRQILAPAFAKATGASVTQSIILGTDQVARLTAAKGSQPPFDVAIFDSPQGFEVYLGQKMPVGISGMYHPGTNRLLLYDQSENRQLLAQLVTNLIENCLKYVPTGGRIDLNWTDHSAAASYYTIDQSTIGSNVWIFSSTISHSSPGTPRSEASSSSGGSLK